MLYFVLALEFYRVRGNLGSCDSCLVLRSLFSRPPILSPPSCPWMYHVCVDVRCLAVGFPVSSFSHLPLLSLCRRDVRC